jgi:anterior pharynx defective protein 1
MPAALFAGCLLVAFGPATVFLLTVVARRSQLTVFAITAAFFELIAILLSSLAWIAMPSSFQGRTALALVVSVLLQETMRFAFVLGYGRVEAALIKASGGAALPFTDFSSAIASGFGFGLLVSLVTYGDVLAASLGEADLVVPECGVSVFVSMAFTTLFLQILHVALMLLAFFAIRHTLTRVAKWTIVVLTYVLHLAPSLVTLLNTTSSGCETGLPLYFVLVVVGSAVSVHITRRALMT